MSVSETAAQQPEPDEEPNLQIPQGVRDLDPMVRKYLGDGNPMLTGPCTVSVSISFENPVTPETAANMAVLEFATAGFNAFLLEVVDDTTGDRFFVRAGQVYTQAELEAELEDLREREQAGGSA